MLRHYVDNVLPNGFKAQVVATSRLAAIRYQQALVEARGRLVAEMDALTPPCCRSPTRSWRRRTRRPSSWSGGAPDLDTIRRLEFAAVISGGAQRRSGLGRVDRQGQADAHIERFKKPLIHEDPTRQDGLAFLCVKSMLLTGFDAPVEQVLYLDRFMQGARAAPGHRPGQPHGRRTRRAGWWWTTSAWRSSSRRPWPSTPTEDVRGRCSATEGRAAPAGRPSPARARRLPGARRPDIADE